MKIHFVKIPDTRDLYPALGFSFVIAEVKKAGFEVEFIDANLIDYPFREFLSNPRASIQVEPDWGRIKDFFKSLHIEYALLTGSFTKYITNTAKLSGILKEFNRRCTTIVGGIHVSTLPEDTLLRFKDIDFVVIGEGEKTTVDLLLALSKKEDFTKIPSIAYRDNGKIIVNEGCSIVTNLDDISFPDRAVWPKDEYRLTWKYLWEGRDPLGVILTSRGCVGRCIFCASGKKGVPSNALRFRSFENIKAEIDFLVTEYNIHAIDFIDDCFTLNKERLILVCNYLKEKRIPWFCASRVDTVSHGLLKMMKDSGCQRVFFGIESTNDAVLKTMGKGVFFKEIQGCITLLDKIGLDYTASFTIGHPEEKKESMKATLNFAKRLARKGKGVGIYFITPYPGTHLFELARQKGWIYSDNWDDFDLLGKGNPIYAYNGWTPDSLMKFYRFAWKELERARFMGKFMNTKLILRKMKSLKSLRDMKILFNHFLCAFKRQIK